MKSNCILENYPKIEEGKPVYVYNYTDHLVNVRLSYTDKNGIAQVLQEKNYYPFGLQHKGYNESTDALAQGYKYGYNGKELQDESNLNWYDYGARNYSPALGRWFVIDPLAEEMPGWSPYNFVFNNPLSFIDPLGLSPDSIHLDKYGNVLKNINDGDNGVYVHNDATTKADVDKIYSAENTSAGGEKIGELGGTININHIYANTLGASIKESKGIWNPFTFKKHVKNGGEWDLKNNENTIYGLANDGKTKFSFDNKKMESQDIGNHHFGVVGKAYGLFSETFMLKQAGKAQIAAGTSKLEWQKYKKVKRVIFSKAGTPHIYYEKVIVAPYGDDPRDQGWIKAGFQYYKDNK